MIPKKIHYCWLSNDPLPAQLQLCLDSWKRWMPDYEIVKWDLNRFPLEKNRWVKEAFINKKYAFAADYIRLYALYTEGGIYFDSDVEAVQSFDPLMDLPYFICKENSPQGLEAAALGAEKGAVWVARCLEYYQDKNFINAEGRFQTEVLPRIMERQLRKYYSLVYLEEATPYTDSSRQFYVLPSDFFSPKNYVTKKIHLTSRTYSIHHFAGSWQPLWKKALLRIWVPFSAAFPRVAAFLKRN